MMPLTGLLLATVVWSCSGISDSNAVDCGTRLNATSTYTVAPLAGYNLFSVSTPLNASSKCDAQFTLTFRYADPTRALSDSTMPPLIGLDSIFHADADSIVFTHGAPTRNKSTIYVWTITGTGINSNSSSLKSAYYIKVQIGPSAMADSTMVTGNIDFSLQK